MAIRDNVSGGALTETTFLILLAVYCQPRHGYGIMQFIEKETNGRVVLGAGTLYGAINTLLKKKWIMPVGNENIKNKKEYIITDIGRKAVEEERKRIGEIWRLATKIIGGETI